MTELECKLCKPKNHSFAKDGRKSSWSVVQKGGLRQKLEDDYFRIEEYHGSMPRWKFRIMIHRNDFYLRIAVSSDLDKLLQKYWQYFHSVLPTMIPSSVQDEKDRMSWIIQHITFMYKQEKKNRLKGLKNVSDDELMDLHHLDDLEEFSEWSSEEEDAYSVPDEPLKHHRSGSEASVVQHSPPKPTAPISTASDRIKYKIGHENKSFSDPHVGERQLSRSPPKVREVTVENSAEHDTQNDSNNNNNNNVTQDLNNNLTRSNSLPMMNSEDTPIGVAEEKKKSKWKQFFKRKDDSEGSDEAHEEKNAEPKKLERDDMSRLSVYASIDRDRPSRSPSLFKKLKKKNEQDAAEKEGTSSQSEMDTKTFIKGVFEELFDPDAPRDVRTYKYCILGVLFSIFYAFCLRWSSFDLFMVLLIVLNAGIVYGIKERRTFISMFAKRKLRKVVKQEKRKFLGWLPNSNSTQNYATKLEKEKEKEKKEDKDMQTWIKQEDKEKEPLGTS